MCRHAYREHGALAARMARRTGHVVSAPLLKWASESMVDPSDKANHIAHRVVAQQTRTRETGIQKR
jgi:hypothetical protein